MKRYITGLSSWAALTLLVQKRWEKNQEPFVVTIGKPGKTWKQLAFLHDAILEPLAQVLFDAGEIKKATENQAKYWLKVHTGFGEWFDYNGGLVFYPYSFQDADIEQLSAAIDKGLDRCAIGGINIESKGR